MRASRRAAVPPAAPRLTTPRPRSDSALSPQADQSQLEWQRETQAAVDRARAAALTQAAEERAIAVEAARREALAAARDGFEQRLDEGRRLAARERAEVLAEARAQHERAAETLRGAFASEKAAAIKAAIEDYERVLLS